MEAELLRRAEVLQKTGLSNSTLWRLESAGKFPPRRHISAAGVAWLSTEVEEWVMGRKTVSPGTVRVVAVGAGRGRKS